VFTCINLIQLVFYWQVCLELLSKVYFLYWIIGLRQP